MTPTPSEKKVQHDIELLRAEIERHNRLYYVEARPSISDLEFDRLLKRLEELERNYPQFDSPDSPTHRVSGEPIEGFETVQHTVPMLSIDNTYSVEELRAWYQRVLKGLSVDGEKQGKGTLFAKPQDVDMVCDPKIDGVAVSLRYEDGALVRAVTRGDGEKGDDVTAQVRAIRAIPLRLKGSTENSAPKVLEVRGEIFMPYDAFKRLNIAVQQNLAETIIEAERKEKKAKTHENMQQQRIEKLGNGVRFHGCGITDDLLNILRTTAQKWTGRTREITAAFFESVELYGGSDTKRPAIDNTERRTAGLTPIAGSISPLTGAARSTASKTSTPFPHSSITPNRSAYPSAARPQHAACLTKSCRRSRHSGQSGKPSATQWTGW